MKVGEANARTFNKDNILNYTVKVPQQNNFTDCGLYLLQYVEHFFTVSTNRKNSVLLPAPCFVDEHSFNAFLPQNPIKDYRQAPMNKQLSNWFDSIVVTRKREDISNLLKKLVGKYSPENLPLPDIPLPTLNGKLALNFSSLSWVHCKCLFCQTGELIETEDTYNEADEMAEFEEEEMDEEEVKLTDGWNL